MPIGRIPFSLAGKRVWVTGHLGMVGQAMIARLQEEACTILTASRAELDLRRQAQVEEWVSRNSPEVVFAVAAKVGGILANRTFPAEFVYENLAIQNNVIHSSLKGGVEKLLFLGSNCNYPQYSPQPIQETALMQGPLEESIQWYAVAKIAGIMMCKAYRRQYGFDCVTVMPPNLFGAGDNYDALTGHVCAGILRRVHEAKAADSPKVDVWGSGNQRREFLYVEDLADALVFVMKNYSEEEILNVGCGQDMSIAEFAHLAGEIVGYRGKFNYDRTKPDGTPRKVLDSTRLEKLGWKPHTSLRHALGKTYEAFLADGTLEGLLENPVAQWPADGRIGQNT